MKLSSGKSLICVALLAAIVGSAIAQPPAAPVVIQVPTPKQSRYAALDAKMGVFVRKDHFVVQSARDQGITADVVRLEDMTNRQVAFGFRVTLTEHRGVAIVSEEEMPALKDAADYMVQNLVNLNESNNYVHLEYVALSGASFGYFVHRLNDQNTELPPAACVEVPHNPYYPEIGGFQTLSAPLLQKIVAEAQQIMADQRQQK